MKLSKCIVFLAVFVSTQLNANSLTCPQTIRSGAQLTGIYGTVENYDCYADIEVTSKVISILSNSGGGAIGMTGPTVKTLGTGNVIIPHADCGFTYTPSSYSFPFNWIAMSAAPANTLAVITAAVMDVNNKIIMVGPCNVRVTP